MYATHIYLFIMTRTLSIYLCNNYLFIYLFIYLYVYLFVQPIVFVNLFISYEMCFSVLETTSF